ncbi:MAG: hypothetical protein QF859_01975 [Candidatus Marinimicrobia bacterium]|jgi:hypothetical protein|nr:hypothetical protein [Candidatus Neomarinimicrobiota bacterium]
MLLKRHIPLMIVIGVGLLTLFGHFINNDSIQAFVDKDALQWFDIIASFAVFLGALNMLKLQLIKIIKKQKNWQYSILAVIGFAFAIFAGFFYRGANFITLSDVKDGQLAVVSEIIAEELNEPNPYSIQTKLEGYQTAFEIDKIYMTSESAKSVMEKLNPYVGTIELKSKPWGAHVQTKGSLFYWMFINIITPLSATMFALLAFFVASASYRAFRIRNFEATLLLVAGIILMLGRVPIGGLIPWWAVSIMLMFGIGAIAAPFIKERSLLLGIMGGGIVIIIISGTFMGWNQNPPELLSIPVIQDWIFAYPTMAGSRALMIGIALGIVATSFRIIIGLDKSFLGDK